MWDEKLVRHHLGVELKFFSCWMTLHPLQKVQPTLLCLNFLNTILIKIYQSFSIHSLITHPIITITVSVVPVQALEDFARGSLTTLTSPPNKSKNAFSSCQPNAPIWSWKLGDDLQAHLCLRGISSEKPL